MELHQEHIRRSGRGHEDTSPRSGSTKEQAIPDKVLGEALGGCSVTVSPKPRSESTGIDADWQVSATLTFPYKDAFDSLYSILGLRSRKADPWESRDQTGWLSGPVGFGC